jgi:tRNA threonylcarbamoyladenosine biosynthesis protein TsaE
MTPALKFKFTLPAAFLLSYSEIIHPLMRADRSGSCYLWSMEWLFTIKTMPMVAEEFWNHFRDQKIFAIHGKMGVGKTTFIQALCRAKKVGSSARSPSFSIINEYQFAGGKIFHLDLYRLKGEEEAFRAGVEECLYSGEICLVEWPEIARRIFPPLTVDIYISEINPETRIIQTGALP